MYYMEGEKRKESKGNYIFGEHALIYEPETQDSAVGRSGRMKVPFPRRRKIRLCYLTFNVVNLDRNFLELVRLVYDIKN